MAGVALAHTVADADSIFGVYVPQHARPGLLLAPLLNGNHLAALFTLGLPIAAWELQTSERTEQRILWAGACLGLLGSIILTLSRSGLLAGVAAVGVYLTAPQRSATPDTPRRPLTQWLFMGSGLTALAALSTYGADLVAREFGDTASARDKATLILKFVTLAVDHPWLGVGRGAFGDVSLPLAPTTAHAAYAENLIAQWFVEWGVPASLLLLASLIATALGIKRERGLTYSVACGLFGLAMHDASDFALEVPGIALPAAIALGTVLYSRARPEAGGPTGYRLRSLLAPAALSAAGSVCLTWTLQTTGSRETTHHELEVLLKENSPKFDARLTGALAHYPLDPALYVLGAGRAVRAHPTVAASWLNLAMSQAPGWASPHVQASYWLEGRGQIAQSGIEMGIALESDLHGVLPLACELLLRHPSPDLAWIMTPDGSDGQIVAEELANCIRLIKERDAVASFLAQVIERYPSSLSTRAQQVQILISVPNLSEALATARKLNAMAPRYGLGVAMLIRALTATGDMAAARRAYLAAEPKVRRQRAVLTMAVEPLVKLRDLEALREVLDTLQSQSQSAEDEVNLSSLAGEAYADAGDIGRALRVFQTAYRRHRNPALLERIHQLASAAGLSDVALRAALELCHLRHRDRAFCEGTLP